MKRIKIYLMFFCALSGFGLEAQILISLPVITDFETDTPKDWAPDLPVPFEMSSMDFPKMENLKLLPLEDSSGCLNTFYEKLRFRNEPVRIVHIGDSHVRGYVFPATLKMNFERDFGDKAVFPDTLDYRTSTGIARETGLPGIVYHVIGVNGAVCSDFIREEQLRRVTSLKPDLIIISFGTNECHGRGYDSRRHYSCMKELVDLLKLRSPETSLLLTTPPGAFVKKRVKKRRIQVENPRTETVAKNIIKFGKENNIAYWDLYSSMGGKGNATKNWRKYKLINRDGIHFTKEGYRLQGNLLYEVILKAYNNYVAN